MCKEIGDICKSSQVWEYGGIYKSPHLKWYRVITAAPTNHIVFSLRCVRTQPIMTMRIIPEMKTGITDSTMDVHRRE